MKVSIDVTFLDKKEDAPITGPLGAWNFPVMTMVVVDDEERISSTASLVNQIKDK